MASININEIDASKYSTILNLSDNIVYVIGCATSGPSEQPVLCRSYTEFIETFGKTAPEGTVKENVMTSWDYAVNLLIEGFPVLFERISGTTSTPNKATATVSASVNSSTVNVFGLTAKDAGTRYNGIKVSFSLGTWVASTTAGKCTITVIDTDGTSVPFDICDLTVDDTMATMSAKVISGISNVTSDLVEIAYLPQSDVEFDDTAWATDYTLAGGIDITEADVIDILKTEGSTIFAKLEDTDLYDVKFLTLGGMETKVEDDIYGFLVSVAEKRGDCFCIVDAPMLTSEEDYPTYFTSIDTSYATAFAPWIFFSTRVSGSKWASPSFVYLFELAKSVSTGNPVWLPIAGVNRGSIPEAIKAEFDIGKITSDKWQDSSNTQFVNPLRKVKDFGYTIWGQKTLQTASTALRDLNVRITANEIKRKISDVALSLTYEPNALSTWNSFRGEMDTYLSQLLADGALYDYKIIVGESITTDDDIDNNIMRGVVVVRITRLAEEFNIDFYVANNVATFNEIVSSYS